MNIPSFSTFSAIAELFVTAAVLFIVSQNYKGKGFSGKLALTVILFEFSVNMLYMIHRLNQATSETTKEVTSGFMVAVMAIHGSLSLLVFIMLAILCSLAFLDFKKGKYFFQSHKKVTFIFLGLWLLSVISGEVLYYWRWISES
ncbi:MAG: hypothetical protein KDD55_05210 [Bdellovibrionales bacterium]|nr:hypothetical protein [Bdellovibrionales bacterium]